MLARKHAQYLAVLAFVLVFVGVVFVRTLIPSDDAALVRDKVVEGAATKSRTMLERSVRIKYLAKKDPSIAGKRHSKHRCVGNQNSINDYPDRTCLFMNICYDKVQQNWNYYRIHPRPILYDAVSGPIYNFTGTPNNGQFVV
jgi:hypothetical protein